MGFDWLKKWKKNSLQGLSDLLPEVKDDMDDFLIASSSEEENIPQLDIEDLDETFDSERFVNCCQFIGVDEKNVTEAAAKEAYFNKRTEIRSYRLSNENTLLAELKENLEYVVENISLYKQEQGDAAETMDIIAENNGDEEDAVLWDEAIKDISPVKEKRLLLTGKKRKIAIICMCLIILMAAGIPDIIAIVSNNWIKPTDIEKTELIAKQGINNGTNKKIYCSLEEIQNYSDVICTGRIPIIKGIYGYQEYDLIKESAQVHIKEFYLLKYKKAEEGNYILSDKSTFTQIIPVNIQYEGIWEGGFKTSAESDTISQVKIELEEGSSPNVYTGICTITGENKKEGIYTVEAIAEENSLEICIKGIAWLNKPTFFIMNDFEAVYDMETGHLIPARESGIVFDLIYSN